MKKDKYYEIAEKMYTEQFITVAGIAKRLGVNERTIKRWKKDGNWTEKRYQYLYKHTNSKDDIYVFCKTMLANFNHTNSKDDIYVFCKTMLANFNSELQNGNKIDTSRLNVFLNLVEELVKKEQKDFEIEKFIKVAQKRLDYEEEMLKEMENEMKTELQEDFEE